MISGLLLFEPSAALNEGRHNEVDAHSQGSAAAIAVAVDHSDDAAAVGVDVDTRSCKADAVGVDVHDFAASSGYHGCASGPHESDAASRHPIRLARLLNVLETFLWSLAQAQHAQGCTMRQANM